MNRPKKEFIPTTLSDLNIDSISIGSNGDRHNNNSNGARVNNFDRFKATSSSNLSYKHSNLNNNNNNNIASNSNNSKRSSKLYSSQSNLSTTSSTGSRYQAVVHSNNYNTNSSKATAPGDPMDKWMQAWEDTNNNFRAPSYHTNAQQQQQQQHSKMFNKINHDNYKRSNSNNFNSNKQATVVVEDPFDPFDDTWSGISLFSYYLLSHLFFSNSAYLLFSLHTTRTVYKYLCVVSLLSILHIVLFSLFFVT